MKRLLVILSLLVVCNILSAQVNITVKGTTVNGEGKEIELYRYTDRLSSREVLVDKAVIGDDQAFELHAFANYPTLMFLQIENYSQSFYVEPGRTYTIYIRRFDWDIDETKNVFLEPEVLPVEFLGVANDELNMQISRMDYVVDSFIATNIVHFDQKFRPQRAYFDTLVRVVEREVPDGDNEFFNRYKRYHLAEMRYKLHFASRSLIFGKMIKDNPIRYYDENYMSMFYALFEHSVSKGNRYVDMSDVVYWVNSGRLNNFLDSIGLDPILRNEEVRELVALQALKEAYYDSRNYDQQQVVAMVERFATRSKFPEQKRIAQGLLESFSQMRNGAEVPTFTLPNVEKQLVSLESYKGKWIYLSFIRVGDPNSIREIETLAHFKDSIYAHSDNVEFITIVCDREFQKMYHFLKNNRRGDRYSWTWLHFNNNFKLLEHYQVVRYPTFLLINPDGKLQYNVTPYPASGFLLSPPWQTKKSEDNSRSLLFR